MTSILINLIPFITQNFTAQSDMKTTSKEATWNSVQTWCSFKIWVNDAMTLSSLTNILCDEILVILIYTIILDKQR